ncbi:MAG: hypothetical protein GEU80_05785 [Dehalococcoidia bacterium]|nr:hypothetical protein [Dehalococcoidia bacterium]
MPSPIVQFHITSEDPTRTRAFFEQVFDWKIGDPGTPAVPIDPQGPGDFDVKGAFRQGPEGAPSAVTLFFRVADLWVTVEKAESLGARVLVPIQQQGGAGPHFAIVRTPEGQPLGIVQA